MGEILFLAHRMPFPPDRGDKIRSHHLLKALVALAPVHVGTFCESPQDRAHKEELAKLAKTHCLRDRTKPLWRAGIEAVVARKPVSLTAFDDTALRGWVSQTLADHPIDTIFVFSGQMGQYIPDDFTGRVVFDLCDVDSAKFDAYADQGERRWINRREGRLLGREEARLARRADNTLLITEAEAALFRSRLGDISGTQLTALGNGIDADFFDPAATTPHPELATDEGPHLVFTGQMDYRPNVEAALWIMRQLMPVLRQRHPHAFFHLVGRAPTLSLRALHGENGVRVWGEVPDVRPFLAAAHMVVAPLIIARGVQNKVLEAMAMARPVVLTPEAATGIDAQDGLNFAICPADPHAMSDVIAVIYADAERAGQMGRAARQFVLDTKSWGAVLAPLAGIVQRRSARDEA
ncbi:TIGR03087 family PEP-CTERM/XrtA system glycosyltransferase [Qipengyuania marisflavi]|uniref:TIGR03087 family PEP-CTERM/XrtA system glycosyltransferase n=2 Tax=Qipengyuania marisflavi TaxID=2486356 RepID=A0A5S3PCI6_9SPHN|nr:TIGR03087 family PEP-CTERM/XrtA system glycosyltransferase [Qipengyuania marisflavi]TMM50475.1 TIGR03087 family PEP-CTERM/XrtA system glycosyltransferase [Qipengyuania marisflavi]